MIVKSNTMVEQLTQDPKFKDSNSDADGSERRSSVSLGVVKTQAKLYDKLTRF
jgi:hypothetical protein